LTQQKVNFKKKKKKRIGGSGQMEYLDLIIPPVGSVVLGYILRTCIQRDQSLASAELFNGPQDQLNKTTPDKLLYIEGVVTPAEGKGIDCTGAVSAVMQEVCNAFIVFYNDHFFIRCLFI